MCRKVFVFCFLLFNYSYFKRFNKYTNCISAEGEKTISEYPRYIFPIQTNLFLPDNFKINPDGFFGSELGGFI